jgi:hypothetical protein
MRRSRRDNPAHIAPDPTDGWSRQIDRLKNATIYPPVSAAMRQHAGILPADGTCCTQGATWRYERRLTLPPKRLRMTVPKIEGRWLWAGPLFGHFGHFLTESTSRLWALNVFRRNLDGVLFMQKRPNGDPNLRPFQRALLDLFGVDVPVRIVDEHIRVDRLIVPGQGFGLGLISAGTPEMRDFVHQCFAKNVAPEGPERLYISRSGLGEAASMILCETQIESCLSAAGYHIFHPQDHSLEVQIAHFRAARDIIVADGSAAHLLGFVARPDQRIAYLLRRTWFWQAQTVQLAGFTGREPTVINAIRNQWFLKNAGPRNDLSFAELDMAQLKTALSAAGFIDSDQPWPQLTDDDVQHAFERMGLWGDVCIGDPASPPTVA